MDSIVSWWVGDDTVYFIPITSITCDDVNAHTDLYLFIKFEWVYLFDKWDLTVSADGIFI